MEESFALSLCKNSLIKKLGGGRGIRGGREIQYNNLHSFFNLGPRALMLGRKGMGGGGKKKEKEEKHFHRLPCNFSG